MYLFGISGEGHRQTIGVSNLGKAKGNLYIAWYNKPDGFRDPATAVYSRIVETTGENSMQVAFNDIPAGTYAVAIFLDENGNGKIDTNMFGAPKEKYGFSNNIFHLTRAASFKEASFVVGDKEGTINIKLK